MIKNERNRIKITLSSVMNVVDGVIIYDTGSTDGTIEIVKEFTQKHNIPLHLLHGDFIDFSTSRNKLLEFVDSLDYKYSLLLDCNDEYKCEDKTFCLKTYLKDTDKTAFEIKQKWFIGGTDDIEYYNIKLIRNKQGFHFKGVVHEYIVISEQVKIERLVNVSIYQDRVQDNDGKSCKRWNNDVILLKKELQANPTDPRNQFYLAQTYECLKQSKKAMNAFKVRALNMGGFHEERFISLMKWADYETKNDNKIVLYLKAFEVIERAEPLVAIAKIYRIKQQFKLAFIFAKAACDLPYPTKCLLWINKKVYSHDRWQELGIVSFYVDEFEIGKNACLKAIESGFHIELNTKNLYFYDKNVVDKCN